jgi:hypothetical protein
MYNTYDKENTDDDDDVTGTYILLSGILAVITSAVNGTTSSPAAAAVAAAVVVVDVRCSLYPKTYPSVWLYPHLASYQCHDKILSLYPLLIYAI